MINYVSLSFSSFGGLRRSSPDIKDKTLFLFSTYEISVFLPSEVYLVSDVFRTHLFSWKPVFRASGCRSEAEQLTIEPDQPLLSTDLEGDMNYLNLWALNLGPAGKTLKGNVKGKKKKKWEAVGFPFDGFLVWMELSLSRGLHTPLSLICLMDLLSASGPRRIGRRNWSCGEPQGEPNSRAALRTSLSLHVFDVKLFLQSFRSVWSPALVSAVVWLSWRTCLKKDATGSRPAELIRLFFIFRTNRTFRRCWASRRGLTCQRAATFGSETRKDFCTQTFYHSILV